ncbi:MAG: fasciclin domain-containing protein [Bacteroidales bacterium]|nr:fasciclin domain-containing protein [Bacteroidales bacterium]
MDSRIVAIILIFSFLLFSCERKDWDAHYYDQPETVDLNIWDVIQKDENLSLFAGYIKDFKYDTLFLGDDPYTLFIPADEAFNNLLDTGTVTRSIIDYHISLHFIQSMNINGKRKIQTFSEKFALFERTSAGSTLDGIELTYESPLYRNGKFFIMDRVALPRPNLYEYYAINNPVLKNYIDSKDSIILDKTKSRPLGFDEFGNTIYDTVAIRFNEFEDEFFPVSEEFRFQTATVVFPLEDDYNAALDEMADALGDVYQDHTDIPLVWQNEVLIPFLLEHGVFENMIEEHEFILPAHKDTLKMKNILGDSVVIDYMPANKILCSNGYAYNYEEFHIPDTLYTTSYRFEAEWLLLRTGLNKFSWDPDKATVTSDASFPPFREYLPKASNDSTVRVLFTEGYDGTYSLEFNVENLFPRKYLMVVRTNMYTGGVYDIYVNDELVMTMDYYDYVRNREVWWSVYQGAYRGEGGYNRFDCWIEHKLDYGQTMIRFDYKGPSPGDAINVIKEGLVIDYIEFFPFND